MRAIFKKYSVNISLAEFKEIWKSFLKSSAKDFDSFFALYENEKWGKIFKLEKNYVNPVNKFNVKRFFDKNFINEICQSKIKSREETSHFKSLQKSLIVNKDEITPEQIGIAKTRDMKEIVEWYWISVKQKFCKCPFHKSDKTWSMKIYTDNFFCFGCQSWDSVLWFVMKYENLNFVEAVKKLNWI